jgi:hypothetical protein
MKKINYFVPFVIVFMILSRAEQQPLQPVITKTQVLNAVVNFSGYSEMGDGQNKIQTLLIKDEFGNYIVPIDTRPIKSGRTSTHFNIIMETTRPPSSYSINGVWPITCRTGTFVFSNVTTSLNSPVLYNIDENVDPFTLSNKPTNVNLGWTSTRMFDCNSGTTGMPAYGINGCAPQDKLSTKTVIGPIFLSMVKDKLIFTLFTKITYDEPSSKFKIIQPKILETKFKFVSMY